MFKSGQGGPGGLVQRRALFLVQDVTLQAGSHSLPLTSASLGLQTPRPGTGTQQSVSFFFWMIFHSLCCCANMSERFGMRPSK